MIDRVVIGGGAGKGPAMVGALRALGEAIGRSGVDRIGEIYAVSVGSWIAAKLCLLPRWDAKELRRLSYRDFGPAAALSWARLFARGAGSDGAALEAILLEDFGEKTLRDAFEVSGKRLVICVSNRDTSLPEFWDHETHPDVKLRVAVRASMGLPLALAPVVVGGTPYADGAVLCPYSPVPDDLAPSERAHTVFVGVSGDVNARAFARICGFRARSVSARPRPGDDPLYDAACVVDVGDVPVVEWSVPRIYTADPRLLMAAGVRDGRKAFGKYAQKTKCPRVASGASSSGAGASTGSPSAAPCASSCRSSDEKASRSSARSTRSRSARG